MTVYDSIPTFTFDGEASLPSTFDSTNNRRRDGLRSEKNLQSPKCAMTVAAALVVLLMILPALVNVILGNGNGISRIASIKFSSPNLGSASADLVVLPNPPPLSLQGRTFNHNPHVKLLSYDKQKVNHIGNTDGYQTFIDDTIPEHWPQMYYQTTEHFQGPGSPILCIIAGEAYQRSGFIYPFVSDDLARHFGAAVVQLEHRFYGNVKPVPNATKAQLLELLTVPQALADVVRFTQHIATSLGCNMKDKTSPDYCPIITVGGSYAGFLSAMARLVYPDYIDMAYSGSGPLLLYGQLADPYVYYDILTEAYDHVSPGCAAAVKASMTDMWETVIRVANETGSLARAASAVDVCDDRLPVFLENAHDLADAIVETVSGQFHNSNLFSYPPGPNTEMSRICQIFQHSDKPLFNFLQVLSSMDETIKPSPSGCFDLRTTAGNSIDDAPDDINHDMTVWDFQCCTDLSFVIGYSEQSMFPAKPPSYQRRVDYCRERYNVTPRPWELVDKWGWDDLSKASNILFTNGGQDIWSGAGITWNVSDTVVSLLFPNAIHHSDLSLEGPSDLDTDDIKYGYVQVKYFLGKWIDAIGK